jgi:hypothetical protein
MNLGSLSEPAAPPSKGPLPTIFTGAYAIPPPPDPGKNRHDGLMVRLALGLGDGNLGESAGQNAAKTELSGFSASLSFDVGGSPIDNLVIHARLAEFVSLNRDITVNRNGGTGNIASVLYAPAVTYYFMPINIYASLAIGAARIGFDAGDDQFDWGKFGVGLNIDAGKEWWVSDNWGIGGAVRFWYAHAARDEAGLGAADDFTGWALLVSGTYQ